VPSTDSQINTATALLQHQAATVPDAAATFHRINSSQWVPTTWKTLYREVERTARAFSGLGLRKSDRLAIIAHTCREWVVAELAGMRAGAAIVGIDPHAGPEQISWILDHSQAAAVVVARAGVLDAVPEHVLQRLTFVVTLDGTGPAVHASKVVTWEALSSMNAPDAGPPPPQPEDPATVIYTSGTTGQPKGIEYSHRQMMTACEASLEAFPVLRQPNRFICWLPMAPLFQRMLNLVAFAGGSTIYFSEDPRQIMQVAAQVRPTVFASVPRFYEKVYEAIQHRLSSSVGVRKRLSRAALSAGAAWSRAVRAGGFASWPLRARRALHDRLVLRRIRAVMGGEIRLMLTGSAATPAWLLEFFHSIGFLLLEAYGISENPVPVAANRPDAYRFGSVGRPLALNSVRLTPDGEVVVKGPAMFHGYLGEPRNPEAWTEDGYYRTGDLGRFDSDGFLYLTGRSSEIIKTSTGRRISPAVVEGTYRRASSIDQVVVIGQNRPFLVALIVPNTPAGAAIDDALVDRVENEIAGLAGSLAKHEQVRAFALLAAPLSVESGELTANLKPRRHVIASRHAALIESMFEPDAEIPAGRRCRPQTRGDIALLGA
jgi:long-chain acyl-CoA synthetase